MSSNEAKLCCGDPLAHIHTTTDQKSYVNKVIYGDDRVGINQKQVMPLPPTILQQAQDLVYGPREQEYAHPSVDASRFVDLLNALYKDKLREPFEPADYARIMLLVKLGRSRQMLKRDTIIDMAGYAEVLARTVGEDA